MQKRSQYLIGAGALAAGILLVKMRSRQHLPLPTVPAVDLERYAGQWYEIAAFPQWFERGCHSTTAHYTLQDGYVEVQNVCRKGGPHGKLKTARGKAFPVPGSHNAKLKVQFFWPFTGDYWILSLPEDYSYALVGTPDRQSLWILSRKPHLPYAIYDRLVSKAQELGFDTSRLRVTDQSAFLTPPALSAAE